MEKELKIDFDTSKIKDVIPINCSYTDLVPLASLEPTQGALKASSAEDLEKLSKSFSTHGYIAPMVLWWDSKTGEKTTKMLDGHQRRHLHLLDVENGRGTLNYEIPVIYAKAPTFNEAMKVLLRLVSVTGDVTQQGLLDFVNNNKFNLEAISNEMSIKSPSLKKVKEKLENKYHASIQKAPEYPIQKGFSEKYDNLLIFCDNEMDWLWLENLLGLQKTQDSNKFIGKTRCISVADLQAAIEKIKNE